MDSQLLPLADMGTPECRGAQTLPSILRLRAEKQPDDVAYTFLRNGEEPAQQLSYGELYHAAQIQAAALARAGLRGGNAVLLFPPGLEFAQALLGCHYAGVAGVPLKLPERPSSLRRVRSVADDAGTDTILTTRIARQKLFECFGDAPELTGLRWIDTDAKLASGCGSEPENLPEPDPDGLSLLQYTSGSTGDPKGVMVTHRNLSQNAAELDELWPLGDDGRIVSWLPTFHDMGLLFGVVLPLWSGAPAYLMAPDAFVRRPMRWLEVISRYRATHAAAPNFAYELCVRSAAADRSPTLDVSSWRVAVNGAEPIRAATLRRFADCFASSGFDRRALCPGYGLAENTLKVAGSRGDEPPRVLWVSSGGLQAGRIESREPADPTAGPLVSCGVPHAGTQVRIVDPRTCRACAPDVVGEIWVQGPCVAQGYWAKPEQSQAVFGARMADGDLGECYLRTGDLGFWHGGGLYIAGRLKDLIIHHGRNHYPQDIEDTVEASVPGLHPSCAAAFSVPGELTEGLVIVVEVAGRVLKQASPGDVTATIAAAVKLKHGVDAHDIVLIRRGTLPRTSSGKVRRQACRSAYAARALTLVGVARPAVQADAATHRGEG